MIVVLVGLELAPGLVRTPAAESLLLLAKALRLLDFEVTVVLPYTDELKALGLLAARRLTPLDVPGFGATFVYEAALPSGAQLCLLEPKERASLPFSALDDDAVLAWFAQAVVRSVSDQTRKGAPPDIVHALGARAGLALAALRVEDGAIGRALSFVDSADLAWAKGSPAEGQERLLGLRAAETIIVPSTDLGASVRQLLDGIAPPSRATTQVVFEGLDTGVHNPATDSALQSRYTPYDRFGKQRTSQKEREKRGLAVDPECPLMLVRLDGASSKAIDTVLRVAPTWVRQGFLLGLVLGSGDRARAESLVSSLPGRVAAVCVAHGAEVRCLLAAADFYLEPVSGDATGRGVLEAQRYGAVPVVGPEHAGRERVVELDGELSSGTGFTYLDTTELALAELGGRLWAAFRRPRFGEVVGRIMALDYAWDRPGRRHAQIYKALLDGSQARARIADLP